MVDMRTFPNDMWKESFLESILSQRLEWDAGDGFRAGMRIAILFLMVFLASCSVHRKMTTLSAASLVEDVAKASYKQSDLGVIRMGMPAYLMLMDGMVESWPDNERLLLSAAQAYSSYAAAFAGADDTALRDNLLLRAKLYALKALEQRGISEPLTSPFAQFEHQVGQTKRSDIPYLFWAASCWGGWVGAHSTSIAAVAELPRAEALMRRALVLDETYHYGGPHLFMGVLYASRPPVAGGSLELSRQHFLKAIEIGQGKFLMTHVYYADTYARKVLDRELFVATLKNVLDTPADVVPELTLMNSVARKKAEALLEKADEFF
jgi:hypothetical protein